MDLLRELRKASGSEQRAISLVESTAADLGVRADIANAGLVALSLCRAGRRPEDAARTLNWKEFEGFCSGLFRAAGYEVAEDVRLSKPRAQIDIVASRVSHVISVDCKHWKRAHSPSALRKFASDQLRRSDALRSSVKDGPPIASVILSFSEPSGSFVGGVAVVPVRSLRSFLDSMESYSGSLELR